MRTNLNLTIVAMVKRANNSQILDTCFASDLNQTSGLTQEVSNLLFNISLIFQTKEFKHFYIEYNRKLRATLSGRNQFRAQFWAHIIMAIYSLMQWADNWLIWWGPVSWLVLPF